MTIRLYKDPDNTAHLEWYLKAASETFTFNDMVFINTSGYVTKYTDGASAPLLGLIQRTIAATATDYASNTKVPVLVAGPNAEYLADATTQAAAQTDVGEYVDVDGATTAHQNLDVGSSSNDDFYVTVVLSSALVVAKIARSIVDDQE